MGKMKFGADEAEEEIRLYLLGEIPEAAQNRVEERLITDGQYFEKAELAEDELVEAYIRDGLSPADREKFERNYLITPERRQRVEISRTLHRVLSEPVASTRTRLLQRGYWMALAASLLIGSVVSTYLGQVLVRTRQAAAARERQLLEQLASQSARNTTLEDELRRAQVNPPRTAALPVLSFLLMPDVFLRNQRSGSPIGRFVINELSADVVLNLVVRPDTEQPKSGYSAVLTTADGAQVWSNARVLANTQGPRRVVGLTIPATIFAPVKYRLTLSGRVADGELTELEEYSFLVVRP